MFRRAECVSEQELLYQVVHLLNGRARAWYQNVYRHVSTWPEFVTAIKGKFLSPGYQYNLLVEIEGRLQRRGEAVGAFINEMELRFRAMPEQLPEEHKIHIIRKNLLPEYTMPISTHQPRTIKSLEEICRRIESARILLTARNGKSDPRKPEKKREGRQLNAVETYDSESEPELAVVQSAKAKQAPPRRSQPADSARKPKFEKKPSEASKSEEKKPEPKCFLCGKKGHYARECEETEPYCYKCGKPKVTVAKCPDSGESSQRRARGFITRPSSIGDTANTTSDETPPPPQSTQPEQQQQLTTSPTEHIEISTILQRIKNDNRPHAEVVVKGKKFIGLLDSGAHVTILGTDSRAIIAELELELKPSNISLRTADGTLHGALASIDIPYEFNDQIKVVSTLVVPSISSLLILGTDFWEAFGIQPVICLLDDMMSPEAELEPEKRSSVYEEHALTTEQKQQLESIKQMFHFANKEEILGHTTRIEHRIDTGEAEPIKQRPYIVSPYVQEKINEEITRMLDKGIIEKVQSPTWLNPIVAVKKSNGKVRLCLDARRLNMVIIKNAYPQQNANRILGSLEGTKFLTAIDLTDAFYQILLERSSRPKTAFAVSSRGTFMYRRMPMGLCNSGATLCELIDSIFGCELEPLAFPYLDDFIVATDTFEKHIEILGKVALKLQEAELQISAEKSRFCMKSLRYLGYVVNESGIQADAERVQPILDYPTPATVKEVRRLIGMASWYRRFRNFSDISEPITNLIRKRVKTFEWTPEAELALQQLKEAMTSMPILGTPGFDSPFQIECDASDTEIGAVLLQEQEGNLRIIAYMSGKLTPTQRKYHVTERECLAVLTAIEKFRPYIDGTRFTVITDHASLTWLQNLKDPNGRLSRWAFRLQGYDFDLKHRKGAQMELPDALSRMVEVVEHTDLVNTADEQYKALRDSIHRQPESFPEYRIESDIVLRHCVDNDGYSSDWKVFVPADKRQEVIRECHDNVLAAHGGLYKTMARVKEKYF